MRDGLTEFLAVVEHGGFTAAAGALGVSTSFVSRQVSRLERRLGARLLARTTRRVRLTDIGRRYHEGAREAVARIERLEAEVGELQGQPRGRLRVTAPGHYAERYVAPLLAEFLLRHPRVSVDLDTRMGIADLVAEGFDLAVRMSALADSSLVARRVQARRLMVCAAPAYLQRHGRPSRPEDLRGHECLPLPGMPWRFEVAGEVRELRVGGRWHSDNPHTLVAAAVAGLGVVRLTDYYLDEPVADGRLQVLLEDYEVHDAATWLVWPQREPLPARLRLLIDFLAERLPEHGAPAPRRPGTRPPPG